MACCAARRALEGSATGGPCADARKTAGRRDFGEGSGCCAQSCVRFSDSAATNTSLNTLCSGYKLLRMLPNWLDKPRRPHPAEFEYSGVVVDANGTKFENGQKVFGINMNGTCDICGLEGSDAHPILKVRWPNTFELPPNYAHSGRLMSLQSKLRA